MPIEHSGGPVPPLDVQQRIWREETERAMREAVVLAEGAIRREMEPNRKTGTSMRSIAHEVHVEGTQVVGRVGSNYKPVRYQSDGTGLYGEHHQVIKPVHARVLRFPQPGNAGFTLAGRQRSGSAGEAARWVFAKSVRGVRPKRYFEQARHVVHQDVLAHFRAAGQRMVVRMGGRA